MSNQLEKILVVETQEIEKMSSMEKEHFDTLNEIKAHHQKEIDSIQIQCQELKQKLDQESLTKLSENKKAVEAETEKQIESISSLNYNFESIAKDIIQLIISK